LADGTIVVESLAMLVVNGLSP